MYEGVLAIWYDLWLVVVGFGASVVLTLAIIARTEWRGNGLVVAIVMVLAVLAGLPLIMMRFGVPPAISDPYPVGYLSIGGVIVAIVLGAGRLLYLRSRSQYALSPAEPEGLMTGDLEQEQAFGEGTLTALDEVTPEQGVEVSALTGGEPAAQEATAWLHFTAGPRAGQSIPLPTGTVNLGRGIDNDIILDDATVSRNHAAITYVDNEYYVGDAGSMSGTMVEGVPATRTPLSSGATLKMGEAELVFMRTEAAAGSATSVGDAGPTGGAAAAPGETVVMQPAESTVMAWLAVTCGPSKGKTYQLKEGDNTIGRSPENDLSIEDTAVTRRHAMVKVQEDRFVLVDLGSRGGTKVGDRRLEGRTISTGGVITVGQTRLSLVEVEAGEPMPGTISGETMVDMGGGGSAVLIAQSGPDSGKSFPLSQGDNSIGRDPSSEVLLSDDTVSRSHAMVRAEQDRLLVFDLGSRAGTLVNGDPIRGHELSAGDSISVGHSQVVLMQPGS